MSELPPPLREILRLLGVIERDDSTPVPTTVAEAVQDLKTRILSESAPLNDLRNQLVEYLESERNARTAEINADAVACINEGEMTLAADFAQLSMQVEQTMKAAAASAAGGGFDTHLTDFWAESRRQAAERVTESDFDNAFQVMTQPPKFTLDDFPVVLPTIARIKRREKTHKRWAELKFEGLSWARIQKRHQAETGERISTDAIRKAVKRYHERHGH